MSKKNLKKQQTPKPTKSTKKTATKQKPSSKVSKSTAKNTKSSTKKTSSKKPILTSKTKKTTVKKAAAKKISVPVKKKSSSVKKTEKTLKPSKKTISTSNKTNSKVKNASIKSSVKPLKKAILRKEKIKVEVIKPIKKEIKKELSKKPETHKIQVKSHQKEEKNKVKNPKSSINNTEAVKPKETIKETTSRAKQIVEPKGKFELEYVIHSSPVILFEFLVSPSGLSEWFCDDVNIRNELFTFFWDGTQQVAKLVKIIEEKLIRFEWVEKNDGSYFEFRIEKDELTNDISLIVTDFAENDEEKKSSKLLWDSQIDKLLHVLGSYF